MQKNPVKIEGQAQPPQTKAMAVVALLEREEGATLDELVGNTGWQKHTARAALTGLKKKGHVIERDRVDGRSRYRIIGKAS